MNRDSLLREDGLIHMYTVQAKVVLDCIERDGLSFVKKEYIQKKYGESSWIFSEAYSFFRSYAESAGFFAPSGADSPIWLFNSPKWLYGDTGFYLIEAAFRKERILLFDRAKWQKVLNLSYVGRDPEDEEAFLSKLERQGIQTGFEAFKTPFYPSVKSEIKKSWGRIFDTENTEAEDIQGAVWTLNREDIVSAKLL